MHDHHPTGPMPGSRGGSPSATDPALPHGQARLSVEYFDGHTARAHRVHMWIEDGMLQLAGRDLIRQVPLPKVRWPERTRHGFRLANMADGGAIQGLDVKAWDAWISQHKLDEPLLVQAQRSWRWAVAATCLLFTLTLIGCWWGWPLATRTIEPLMPTSVDKHVDRSSLQAMQPAASSKSGASARTL